MIKSTLTAAALAMLLAGPALADNDKDRRGDDRYDRYDRYDYRDEDCDHNNKYKNKCKYRRDDRGRDDNDWNRGRGYDDDYRRYRNEITLYDAWRRDGWRHDRGRDDNYWNRGRDWRYVPPARFRADRGFRSGYEMAWRDWDRHGRYDRQWRRRLADRYRLDNGYRSGYEAGWRDAQRYFRSGYRPRNWARDPFGWFFGFGPPG